MCGTALIRPLADRPCFHGEYCWEFCVAGLSFLPRQGRSKDGGGTRWRSLRIISARDLRCF